MVRYVPIRLIAGPVATLVVVSGGALLYVAFGPDWLRRDVLPDTPVWLQTPLLRSIHVLVFVMWTPAWVDLCRAVTRRAWGWGHFAAPAGLAVAGEVAQVWLPNHSADLHGALASLAGVVLGWLWVYTLRPDEAGEDRRGVMR